MHIRVVTFAALAAALNWRELSIELPDGATVGDAVAVLRRSHDAIASFDDRLATAVNMAYVERSHTLADGDELALIPPVSGG